MQTFGVLCLGLLAGWLVNVAVDTFPHRRLWRETWRQPVQGLVSGPMTKRYWLVWIVAVGLGWIAYTQLGATSQALLIAVESWFFLAVAVIDLEHRRVLNRMLLIAFPVVLVANLLIMNQDFTSLLLGAAVGFGLFLCIALLAPGGMGMGDVKLAALIGLTTGLSTVLVALFFGILAGGVAGLAILIKNRFRRGQTMAYAPYLVVGVWVVLLDGLQLLHNLLGGL